VNEWAQRYIRYIKKSAAAAAPHFDAALACVCESASDKKPIAATAVA